MWRGTEQGLGSWADWVRAGGNSAGGEGKVLLPHLNYPWLFFLIASVWCSYSTRSSGISPASTDVCLQSPSALGASVADSGLLAHGRAVARWPQLRQTRHGEEEQLATRLICFGRVSSLVAGSKSF